MKSKSILAVLLTLILLTFWGTGFTLEPVADAALYINLNLSIDIKELKIKDIRESAFDNSGEFYFRRQISGTPGTRLPSSGEISRRKNQYILPSDSGLEGEPFWHHTWEAATSSITVRVQGFEEDPSPNDDDDLGTASLDLDLANYAFLLETKDCLLSTGDYDVTFTLHCAPLISSQTHPDSGKSYNGRQLNLEWAPNYPANGILGYSYLLNNNRDSNPDDELEGTHLSTHFSDLEQGVYWFHIRAQDKDGYWSDTGHFKIEISNATGVAVDHAPAAAHFQLYQNYPNPFNASTIIRYKLSQPAHVKMSIYTMRGEFVQQCIDSYQDIGEYSFNWHGIDSNGRSLPSGVYLYILRSDQQRVSRKMTILR